MALARAAVPPPATTTWKLLSCVAALSSRLLSDRRHFHAHPELRYEEVATAEYIAAAIEALKDERLSIVRGVDGTTGLWADLTLGDGTGPFVMLRADMDGLPIQEASGASYASVNPGCMHACGHVFPNRGTASRFRREQ